MKIKSLLKIVVVIVVLALVVLYAVTKWWRGGPQPGTVPDEARAANRAPDSFHAAAEDYFHDMDQTRDGVVALTPDEVKGRNTWLVWTGGNDRFWDRISIDSFGALDLLKTVSSYPNPVSKDPNDRMKFSRDNRWYYLGLVNEPCFEKPNAADKEHFGLWLDKRVVSPDCPPDPFEDEARYPGVVTGSRGKDLPEGKDGSKYLPSSKKMPVGSSYGYATGIVGLRLFPNPAFDEKAAKEWDAEKFYNDPSYYNRKELVRPYRVGMSCAFCHVGPNPLKPPADPEHPKWENLSSNVGAQYFWIDRIFDWQADEGTYIWQMFHTSRPGTLDTSLVSTDNINNPRTMNALYSLGPRLEQAKTFGQETLSAGSPGSRDNKQFNDYPATASLNDLFTPPATSLSPRVLKDGADSVGALGALNRVYLNIGLFSEEWLLHFNPLVGGKEVTPIEIAVARKNSAYWEATESQTPDMALFFLRSTAPHKLKDAPGGDAYLTKDDAMLNRGKVVFAENCARCHSSKLPRPDAPKKIFDAKGCSGPDYLKCWDEYWAWTKTDEFKNKMRDIVLAPDFLDGNFLSAEFRVPVTLLQTNACSPLATNAIRGNIWDNFSSDTYKDLPSVGEITVYNPATGDPVKYQMPAGGRGYTRPASLISLWSTAPFLLNNSVGKFNADPSVASRIDSFQDSIEKMLLLKPRDTDPVLERAFQEKNIHDFPGVVDRTTRTSYIIVRSGYLSDTLSGLVGWGDWLFPSFYGKCKERTDLQRGDICLGPIPGGTPIGLLTNLNLDQSGGDRLARNAKLLKLLVKLRNDLKALGDNPSDDDARKVFANLVGPLMEVSKCPDYVVNRGHYFGTGYNGEPALSDDDKRALIEFLKTF
jgi:hypothetical protein